MTRHRYTVPLYEDNPLDAEVLEYLTDNNGKPRSDILRSLVRAGYMVMVQHETNAVAHLAGLDEDAVFHLLQLLLVDSKKTKASRQRLRSNPSDGKRKKAKDGGTIANTSCGSSSLSQESRGVSKIKVIQKEAQEDDTVTDSAAKELFDFEDADSQSKKDGFSNSLDDDFNPLAQLQNLAEYE